MANGLEINLGDEVFRGIWASMPAELVEKINLIINLGKYVLIAFLIYVIFLVIKQVLKLRDGRRMALMGKDIHEINKKLDLIIDKIENKHKSKHEAEHKEEHKKKKDKDKNENK